MAKPKCLLLCDKSHTYRPARMCTSCVRPHFKTRVQIYQGFAWLLFGKSGVTQGSAQVAAFGYTAGGWYFIVTNYHMGILKAS